MIRYFLEYHTVENILQQAQKHQTAVFVLHKVLTRVRYFGVSYQSTEQGITVCMSYMDGHGDRQIQSNTPPLSSQMRPEVHMLHTRKTKQNKYTSTNEIIRLRRSNFPQDLSFYNLLQIHTYRIRIGILLYTFALARGDCF